MYFSLGHSIDEINILRHEAKEILMVSCNKKATKIVEDTISELKKSKIDFNGQIYVDIKYADKII